MAVQDAIFSLEAGRGKRVMQWVSVGIVIMALVLVHMASQFRGLRHERAMDQAQLARNIARGDGFVTSVLRPLELSEKLKRENGGVLRVAAVAPGKMEETRQAPLYPLALAGVFRLTFQSFDYSLGAAEGGGGVQHYFPERVIAGFGLLCLLGAAGFLYAVGCSMFDRKAAILAVLFFLGADSVWQLALGGLDACFMMLLLGASVWAWHRALLLEEEAAGEGALGWVALGAGLQSLMVLGRYGWWWVVLPTGLLAFLFFRNRGAALGVVIAVWLAVPAAWFLRNMMVAGNPLGTAIWVPLEGTDLFPGDTLWNFFRPDAGRATLKKFVGRVLTNSRGWLEAYPVASGSLVGACFFLVALMHRFRRVRAEGLKWWGVLASAAAVMGGSLGYVAGFTAEDPANMLVVFAPVYALYGAAMLLVVVDRAQLEIVELRRGLLAFAVCLNAAPLVLRILPPQEPPVCWPPYLGQVIRLAGGFFEKGEVVATDMPEALAWYADRRALALPRGVKDFNEINDFVLSGATKGLLFSPETLDGRLFTEVLSGRGREWAAMFLQRRVPELFPLTAMTALPPRLGDMFGYLLFADRARWQKAEPAPPQEGAPAVQ
ncbi:MAG: hypothetical protein IT577_19765 [Verrucomicrobiae bacterium]|nr:hypothetical protein [Verrucomicrobiae bacterium]